MCARFLPLTLVFLLSFLAAACVSVSGPGSTPGLTGPEAILARADQAYSRGDYTQASTLYSQYLAQSPAGPRQEAVLTTAGLAAERAGRYLQAVQHYQDLTSRFPNSPYARQASLRLPDLYLVTDRPAEAVSLAVRLEAAEKDPGQRAALKLAQARGLWAQSKFHEALEAFLAVRNSSPTNLRTQAEEGVGASLNSLTQPELGEVVRQYGQSYPGPEAAWFLAYQSAKVGDLSTFQAQTQYFRQYFGSHPWTSRLAQLEANPASARDMSVPGIGYSYKPALSAPHQNVFQTAGGSSALPGQIAVAAILPLTGDQSSRYGQDILAGLRLALEGSGGRVTVLEMDTGGEPAKAVRLVQEAAARQDVLVGVGPLASREALAAAQTAQQVGFPLIAISQRLGLTNGRPWVFRIFLTPKHQAEAVVRYAVQKEGLRELGILYPNDLYGQTMLGFFQAEVLRQGAMVTVQDSYNPQLKNWNEAVARLTGGQAVRQASASYQAKTNFKALYLPDSASVVSQILPQMAYNDVTKMVYLGTSMWLTPDLPKQVGRYLSGVIIPEAFSSLSQRPEALRFREAFRRSAGREADQFAAYGYDAGLAVLTALSAGAADRGSIIRLWPTLTVAGATGPFSFDPEGDYLIEPALLTIEKSAFKLLREAGVR
ncbi:MAG: ABC transporter substrate-binding protein [Deltaproteobacteria bacterium]|jgi:ABC-type branched-subunit amino acid transport system substrate-binding protein|nr:ABC transporter substrate-binding protein [Deltaproteobacteria bacterium]